MLSAYMKTKMVGQALWLDFITEFRSHSIRSWTRPILATWMDFLIDRDVYVITGRSTSRSEAIVELLHLDAHINVAQTDDSSQLSMPTAKLMDRINVHEADAPIPISDHQGQSHPTTPSPIAITGKGDGDDPDDPDDSNSGSPWP